MPNKYRNTRRISTAQEKAIYRKFFLTIGFTVFFLIFLVTFGVPILAKLASLFNSGSSKPATNQSAIAPPAPSFDYLFNATNSAQINISGTAQPGSNVILRLQGDETEKLVPSDGNFVFEKFKLSEGKNEIIGVSADDKGNQSSEVPLKITLDTKAPKLDITTPDSTEKQITGGEPKIEFKGKTDEISNVKLNSYRTSVNESGEFDYNYPLSEGDNNIVVTVADQAGNSTSKTFKINYRK